MAVYDVNGNALASLYAVDGNGLDKAYDVDGTEVFSGKYSIDNVQSYFRDATLSVANDLNNLSNDWVSLVFITDPHGSGNKQHSQAIGLYLLDNTPVSMIVLGGDYSVSNWSKTQYDNYMSPLLESGKVENIYALFGNHETYGDGATAEAKSCIYNDFLQDKEYLVGQLTDNYYYFDDTTRKIRYVFVNTSDGGEYTMSSTQLDWIESNVVLPTTEWSLVVFGHVTLNTMGVPTYSNESNGSSVVSAINNCNGNIVGYICGHQHIDTLYNDGNFEHVTLLCDKFENSNYYAGVSVTDREAGTVSEQAVSAISFNTTTRQVVIRRIGAGRNQTMSYSY